MDIIGSKALSNQIHAIRRAQERYGLDSNDAREIESRVRSGVSPECIMLRPDNKYKNRSLWAIKYKNRWIPVTFDSSTNTIVSFLPEDALFRYQEFLSTIEQPIVTKKEPIPYDWDKQYPDKKVYTFENVHKIPDITGMTTAKELGWATNRISRIIERLREIAARHYSEEPEHQRATQEIINANELLMHFRELRDKARKRESEESQTILKIENPE